MEVKGMLPTTTSSSYASSFGNVVIANSRGVSKSAYARATRAGVRSRLGSVVSMPRALIRSAAARSAASRSTSGAKVEERAGSVIVIGTSVLVVGEDVGFTRVPDRVIARRLDVEPVVEDQGPAETRSERDHGGRDDGQDDDRAWCRGVVVVRGVPQGQIDQGQ